jgi:hypothetical protein
MSEIEQVIKRVSGPEWLWDGAETWIWIPEGRDKKPYGALSVIWHDREPFYGLTIWGDRNQHYSAYSYDAAIVEAMLTMVGPIPQDPSGYLPG